MKIIDWKTKGNVVRFYLGADDCEDYWGDDWDDAPYEHNAGTVYDEYVVGYRDMVFPFDSVVIEPSSEAYSSGEYYRGFSKEDMKNRCYPCLIVKYLNEDEETWMFDGSFLALAAADREDVEKFYFGDYLMSDEYIANFNKE